jgi:hypothetical protein
MTIETAKLRSQRRTFPGRRFLAVTALLAFSLSPLCAYAQVPTAFRVFMGSWTGTGTLWHKNGAAERIRCQAAYVAGAADSMRQTLSCSSSSTSFNLVTTVADQGGDLTGDWTESTHGARGTFKGRVGGGIIQGTARGPGFAAGISIAAKGGKQAVRIKAQGGDIDHLEMNLTRAR